MLFRKASLTDRDFINLAKTDPEIRAALSPIVREAAGWDRLPKGWTQESVKKFWSTLTGDAKHKVTKCIERMRDHMDEPGGFCASIADMVDPGWRSRPRTASEEIPRIYYLGGGKYTVSIPLRMSGLAKKLQAAFPRSFRQPHTAPNEITFFVTEKASLMAKNLFQENGVPVGGSPMWDREPGEMPSW